MYKSQDYYGILQVKPSADLTTIKRAYRQKMRVHHPDQFVAELSQAQQSGNPTKIKQLERKVSNAKKMTQKINSAYAVLSDVQERAAYDRYLSEERQRKYDLETRQQRMRHYEGERRTVKTRPHHQNPHVPKAPAQEKFPTVLFVGFIVVVLIVMTVFSNAVTSNHTPFTTYVPRNPTSANSASMADLQATTSAQQATVRARETIALEPTATPRSSSDNEQIADRLAELGSYERAIEVYGEAISASPHNANLYLKRASAYRLWYENDDADVVELALADFDQALALDETLNRIYLERGLLYYAVWQSSGDYADEARTDLLNYIAMSGVSDSTLEDILSTLP